MRIAVHYTNNLHDASFSHNWIEILEKKGVEVQKVNFFSSTALEEIKGCDGVMWNWFHLPLDKITAPFILKTLEDVLNIPVFPNSATSWHYDEKVAQYYLLSSKNYPIVKTWVFHNYDEAVVFAQSAEYPLVLKLSVGASSSNVTKITNYTQALNVINKIFRDGIEPDKNNLDKIKNNKKSFKDYLGLQKINYPIIQKEYVYFQEFLPKNEYDIRVNVIGKRIFAFVRHNRDNDFRASGSGKIDYNRSLIPRETLEIAYKISKECRFQSMAYDFLKDKDGKYVISEISYTYRSKPVEDCNGYWNENLDFVEERISPEEAIIEDFIEYINRK